VKLCEKKWLRQRVAKREAHMGVAMKELCRKHSKYGGIGVSDAKRLKEPEIVDIRVAGDRGEREQRPKRGFHVLYRW
jgi:hypothetical protein